jgi:hypothetical protein
MLAASIPPYFLQPFANNAGAGYVRSIPNTTADTTAASLNLGFPPACFVDVALGGTPPNGQDFNGILNELSANDQWIQAGGQAFYNAAFSTAIGGYPNAAVLMAATMAHFWQSTVDNNTSDPDTGGANWKNLTISGYQPAGAPTGAINGSNQTYVLPTTPATGASVPVYINGLFANLSVDYTITGATITYLGTPLNGSDTIVFGEYRI